ncbi:MAG: TolC family protein, partial [Kiritimatiellia bacterium]|nr:TolC family protein [Kiritimatiellia bacterium]
WNAGLQLKWELFDGGRRNALIDSLRMQLNQGRAETEEAERSITLQIRQAWLRMLHAKETLAAGDETVELAEKSLAIAQTRYEAGLSTALEFADARLACDTALFSRMQARMEWLSALADLEHAAATSKMDWTQTKESL